MTFLTPIFMHNHTWALSTSNFDLPSWTVSGSQDFSQPLGLGSSGTMEGPLEQGCTFLIELSGQIKAEQGAVLAVLDQAQEQIKCIEV